MPILIADSGSTKTQWCLLEGKEKKKFRSQGLSPYFLTATEITEILQKEVLPKIRGKKISNVFFYGTGCSNPENRAMLKKVITAAIGKADVKIDHDLMGAAKALCGDQKGIACILGTGSNSCYFNGNKIEKNVPGLGFILGDEGSGAYLGKKIIQHFLYNSFDEDLMDRFTAAYPGLKAVDILDAVYRKPLPNRFLAGFTRFLSDNRGHYMIENILEDSLNDFFFHHLYKYGQTWLHPVHFTGSIAYVFRDKIRELCNTQAINLGKILKDPMEGLISYHSLK